MTLSKTPRASLSSATLNRLRYPVAFALLSIVTLTPSTLAQMTSQEAFQAGKTDGTTLRRSGGSIIQRQDTTAIPGYTTTPTESTLFQGGAGQLGVPAAAKLSTCAGNTTGSAREDQECNAINFLEKNPSTRPAFAIDPRTDSIIQGSSATIRNPTGVTGTLSSAYSGCSTRTVTSPAPTSTETCQRFTQLATLPCEKTLNVIVYQNGNCVPGDWYARGAIGAYFADPQRFVGVEAAARCEFASTLTLILRGATWNEAWGQVEIRVDAATGTPVAGESPPIVYNFIGGQDYHFGHWHTHARYEGGSCTAEACTYRFSAGIMEESYACPAGWDGPADYTGSGLADYCRDPNSAALQPPTFTQTYVPRYPGSFVFQRARLLYTFEDRWDNQCTRYEARLP